MLFFAPTLSTVHTEKSMNISVNDKSLSIDSCLLLDVLQELKVHSEKGIAIAVNDSVINRSLWPEYRLNEGDAVLVVRATQGG